MQIKVSSCKTCPFFVRTVLSALAGGDGDCKNAEVGKRGLPVEKGLSDTVPRWCPLRIEPTVVALDEVN